LPVTDEVMPYAEALHRQLSEAGVRAAIDRSGERLGKLIRNGETMKIPVLAVIGAREAEAGQVSLRSRRQGDLGSVSGEWLRSAAGEANIHRLAILPLGDGGGGSRQRV
jgi:threonyl-tRNA synthetase